MTKQEAKARIIRLRQEINHNRYLYHVLDTQEISDAAQDSLKAELERLEGQFPDLITADSPTQRVGGKALDSFTQVTHTSRMLSLTDAFSIDDIAQWAERAAKIIPTTYEYFVELKIDGVAVSLVYQDGILQTAATRGDGQVGEDVTHTVRTIEAVPLTLREAIPGRVEVRGEVYMLKKDFEKMNKQRAKEGEVLYANPRNVVAGSIRQLDPTVAASRPLRYFAWELTSGVSVKTRQEEYNQLKELGFSVPPDAKLLKTIDEIESYIKKEETRRLRHPFQVDGLVIKINDLDITSRLGVVGKAPRGSIAYKFAAEEATTIVEDIVVQIGRTGALTPVAHLTPVRVAGTVVSRATLHNADEIARKDVRVGDTVIIRKAGDIIPEVMSVLPRLRKSGAKKFTMPKKCPICSSPVHKDDDGVVVRCTNKACFSQQRERLSHAVSRQAFDIDGLGGKIIERLLQEKIIATLPDLWTIKAEELIGLEGFKETLATKLVERIQSRSRIGLPQFLVAISIPNVGIVTAQDLAYHFGSLDRIRAASVADLVEVDGIAQKVAQEIADFFQLQSTKDLLEGFRAAGVKITHTKHTGALAGKTFVFTGSLEGITRDEAKQAVIQLGGRVAADVGAKVDYVVVGADPGSKAVRANELKLTILSTKKFLTMIGR